jgi:uncharacterized protein YbjT (DUF2867 family)
MSAVRLELLCKPNLLVHQSHSLVASCHRTDRRDAVNVTEEGAQVHTSIQKIAVAGATGRVGRHVVEVLDERGVNVVPIARSRGVDVISRQGLHEALREVDCIIDVATGPSPDQQAATEFFTTAARNLQELGAQAGVQRIVAVSIIGIEHVAGGYSAAKIAHERAVMAGPLPARVLRASQFHEFVAQLVEWGTQGEVAYVPNMRTQLVAARTVAEALVDLALASDWSASAGPIPEIAGPREESLVEMAKLLGAQRGNPKRIEAVSDPSNPEHAAYTSGALLPGPHAKLAGPTFEQWLTQEARVVVPR